MAKFTVDRRTWYRGKEANNSRLLTHDGMRCCIGFVGQQCGIPDENLLDRDTIFSRSIEPKWPTWLTAWQSSDGHYVYQINDSSHYSDAEREARLKALFAENGDEIEFIN